MYGQRLKIHNFILFNSQEKNKNYDKYFQAEEACVLTTILLYNNLKW